jgi:hypothetical protein
MRKVTGILVGCFLVLLVLANAQSAASALQPSASPTSVSGNEGGTDDQSTSPAESVTDHELVLTLGLFVLLGLVTLLIVLHAEGVQKSAYAVMEKFGTRRIKYGVDYVQSFSQPSSPSVRDLDQVEQPDLQISVKVPATIELKEVKTATVVVTNGPGVTATWTGPADALKIEPDDTTFVAKLTGLKVGSYQVSLKLLDEAQKVIVDQLYEIAVVEPAAQTSDAATVPFVGKGLYTAVAITVLVALLAFIGVTGIITGSELAILVSTLLGAVLGVTVSGLSGGGGTNNT